MNQSTSKTKYESLLPFYDKLVATNSSVQRKGNTVPNTTLNGHMFSYLGKSGELALRLPENERALFLKRYKTKLCELYGVIQKEYVLVPESLLRKTEELKPYFDASYAYVSNLKPKSGKKTKG